MPHLELVFYPRSIEGRDPTWRVSVLDSLGGTEMLADSEEVQTEYLEERHPDLASSRSC